MPSPQVLVLIRFFIRTQTAIKNKTLKIVDTSRGSLISTAILSLSLTLAFCGLDGTRTRDPLRDRQVF
jgi:hypothetical protein